MKLWAVSLCLVIAVVAPAGAQSSRYSTPPRTEGPLVPGLQDPECEEDALEGTDADDGRMGVCEWHFALSPSAESDLANEYEATWMQLDADPPTGWCVVGIDATWKFEGAEIVSASRTGPMTYESIRRVEERLEVDAGGEASSPAAVFTKTVAQPGRVKVRVKENSLSYRWRGRSPRVVSVVLGWQLRTSVTEPIYRILSTQGATIAHC